MEPIHQVTNPKPSLEPSITVMGKQAKVQMVKEVIPSKGITVHTRLSHAKTMEQVDIREKTSPLKRKIDRSQCICSLLFLLSAHCLQIIFLNSCISAFKGPLPTNQPPEKIEEESGEPIALLIIKEAVQHFNPISFFIHDY